MLGASSKSPIHAPELSTVAAATYQSGESRGSRQYASFASAVAPTWSPRKTAAVDWSARVWVNGRFVTEHEGGYTPFEVDLSRYVRPGQIVTLTVRVWDACDADTPLGKQTEEWYTHSGGIWQTVWLEARPSAHLVPFHLFLPMCRALMPSPSRSSQSSGSLPTRGSSKEARSRRKDACEHSSEERFRATARTGTAKANATASRTTPARAP